MELLELEMRARAIKSLMHQQAVPGSTQVSTPEGATSPVPAETQVQGTSHDISSVTSDRISNASNSIDSTVVSASNGASHSNAVEPASKKQPGAEPDNQIEEYIPPGKIENGKGRKSFNDTESLVPISDNDVLITEISDEETAP